jgi:biopolymer transport protein ExbD
VTGLKPKLKAEVELQVTPMLDMAFQILFFFVMTYKAAPAEGQFSLNLLPAQPATRMDAPLTAEANSSEVPAGLRTLPTTLHALPGGRLGRVTLGEVEISGMDQLKKELEDILGHKDEYPFDQALLKVDPKLRYSELIQVIDVFSRLKVTKISFSELDPGAEGGG